MDKKNAAQPAGRKPERPCEDVDDYVFRDAPEWCASDR